MLYQLIVSALVFIPGIVAAALGKKKASLLLLLFASLAIRLMMIGLDPFLHDWDERFHAAVAKNMMQYPFKPMMRLDAILPYKVEDWCCNYIWVHKQPLFLWQMALSLKIFGINTVALRLPSALMGTFMVYCIYRITNIWTRNDVSTFITALLFSMSYYSLELCSGRMSLDHNDLMMGGYVTASFWAFCEYTEKKAWKWALWAGIFAGCAVLVKWLTGLLIFGGWGIYLLLDKGFRSSLLAYKQWLGAFGASIAVFLPWQLYIIKAFPAESAASYANNYKHIFDDLDHPGNWSSHFEFMPTAYSSNLLLALMIWGFILSFLTAANKKLSVAMAAMFWVVYGFFSLIVATKMPGFTYPVAAVGFIWIGMAVQYLAAWGQKISAKLPKTVTVVIAAALSFGLGLLSFNASEMALARKDDNLERNKEIHNSASYRLLNQYVQPDEVILNCKSFEDTEVRFWQPNNAYHFYPTEPEVNDMLNRGYKLAVFKSHNGRELPGYITKNPRIKIIDLQLE